MPTRSLMPKKYYFDRVKALAGTAEKLFGGRGAYHEWLKKQRLPQHPELHEKFYWRLSYIAGEALPAYLDALYNNPIIRDETEVRKKLLGLRLESLEMNRRFAGQTRPIIKGTERQVGEKEIMEDYESVSRHVGKIANLLRTSPQLRPAFSAYNVHKGEKTVETPVEETAEKILDRLRQRKKLLR